MGFGMPAATAVAIISAMVTPALLLLASVSLVVSALARMARVVDRARALIAVAHEGTWAKLGVTEAVLRVWLERHARRARYVELCIGLLYAAIVVFLLTCLSLPLVNVAEALPGWLPAALAVGGMLLLLVAGALMVAESRLSGRQIAEELSGALRRLDRAMP